MYAFEAKCTSLYRTSLYRTSLLLSGLYDVYLISKDSPLISHSFCLINITATYSVIADCSQSLDPLRKP